jgi:small subunit ribosomal protein S21
MGQQPGGLSHRSKKFESLVHYSSSHNYNRWRFCMVRLLVRDRETIQEAVRRFRKLVERSGLKKEMRRREFYEKPSEIKRRSKQRAERRSRRMRLLGI